MDKMDKSSRMSASKVRPPRKFNHFELTRPTDLAAAYHYDKVLGVLAKEPNERSDSDIYQIKSWFQKKSDLFNQLNDEIILDLIKNCEFVTVERDHLIIKQGDKGDCFFIILNGSVAIFIGSSITKEDGRQEGALEEPESLTKDTGITDLQEDFKEMKFDRSNFGKYVGKIESGKSFGELALLNTDCVRNASIIAEEATDLIVINRELFNRCIRLFHAKEFAERNQFVETNPLFRGWLPKFKVQMAMSLRKEKLNFERVIVKQGDRFDGLRFITSGQAKLTSDPHMHSIQYPDYYPLPDVDELEKDEVRESLRQELKMNECKSATKSRPKLFTNDTDRSDKRSPKQSNRNIELCLICSQEIIGDMEVAMELDTYSYTVTCIQETEMYVLDQKNYERLIEKRHPQTIEKIKNSVQEKYSLTLSWIKDKKEIPLFRYLIYKIQKKERKQKIKQKEIKGQDKKIADDWIASSLKTGPLVDMFGPGSVFHIIRMKAKQRNIEKLDYKANKRITRECSRHNKYPV
ncbi:uncharacterized protein LOC134683669 [Mytilus trossulus]|uniref:uncharacterized protein LOC134683669 n=1 Tax=Mytilus trossulus TaxID=6551 RepID=UPI0030075B46